MTSAGKVGRWLVTHASGAPGGRIAVRARSVSRLHFVQAFVLAGMVALPLQAAGTVEVVYTLAPSYLLFGIAIVLGLPETVRGVRLLPSSVVLAGTVLILIYLSMIVVGDYATVAEQVRGGTLRATVYSAYVVFGLALVALVVGTGEDAVIWRILWALVVGGALVASYGVYSWFAVHYKLPLADINNAVNSDGFTYGNRPRGTGLFGWERIRGTFTEPIGLGAFLTVVIPLTVPLLARAQMVHTRLLASAALALMFAALALTASSISGASLILGLVVAILVSAVARRAVKLVAIAVVSIAAAGGLIFTLLFNPAPLSAITGRSTESLNVTLSDRTSAWRDAGTIWATRPVTGFGPGQASARLAERPDPRRAPGAPVTLRSAQGIVMSSLVDTGIVGFSAWIGLFGATLTAGVRTGLRRRDLVLPSIIAATIAAIFVAMVNGDRVDLRVWVVMSILLATVAHDSRQRNARQADQRAD